MTDDITVSNAAQLWLERGKLEGLERATLRSYESHVRCHIEPKIGDLLLRELTSIDVREFLDSMLRESTMAMAKKCLTSIRSLISEAQGRGLVSSNVAREVKLRNSRRNEPDRRFPTKDEIRLLLKNVSDERRPLVITAIFTGMRASELRGLTWKNVDLDNGVITVCQRADRYNDIGKPKSRAGRREIPMTPQVRNTLVRWKPSCPAGPLDLVFPNGVGNVESHSNIYNRVFKPLMILCGLANSDRKPSFGIHSLRHAAASLFIEQGWPANRVQALLGHSSISITFDVYGHLFCDPAGDQLRMAKLEEDLMAA